MCVLHVISLTSSAAGISKSTWADAPRAVREAAALAPDAISPTRVVENREAGADGIIYELYAGAELPIMEVRFADGQAAIMPPAH